MEKAPTTTSERFAAALLEKALIMNAFQEWKLRQLPLVKSLWLVKTCKVLHIPVQWLVKHWTAQMKYEEEYRKKLNGMARVTLGYEGALECPGRDSQEFFDRVWDSMAESIQFWQGTVSPRLHRVICLNNPSMFPLDAWKYMTVYKIAGVLATINEWAIPLILVVSVLLNIYMVNQC